MTRQIDAGDISAAAEAGVADLRFRLAHRFRPFNLIAPGLTQFDTDLPADRAEILAEQGLRLTGESAPVRIGRRPVAPFATVIADIAEQDATGTIDLGLATDGGDAIVVALDLRTSKVSITVTVDGARDVVAEQEFHHSAPLSLAFTVNEFAVTALVRTDGQWTPLVAARDEIAARVDLRRPEVLARYGYAFGGSGTLLERVRAGYFGHVGLRDPRLVQHADGRPYLRDGRLMLTFISAGMGFAQQAHWSVWAVPPEAPERMEQVGALFFKHDGLVNADHAGQIVYDDDTDEFIALTCTGNIPTPGVSIRHARTSVDLLSGVNVLPNEHFDLPATGGHSAWDPGLTKIDSRWHLTYVDVVAMQPQLTFHPVLAAAEPGADYRDPLRVLGADIASGRTEGCVLQRFGGQWYVLASDETVRQYPVYDLSMRRVGALGAPYLTGTPFPQVVPVDRDGRAGWLLITSDDTHFAQDFFGYGTHGDVVVMRSADTKP